MNVFPKSATKINRGNCLQLASFQFIQYYVVTLGVEAT